jgi:hypothetical protein
MMKLMMSQRLHPHQHQLHYENHRQSQRYLTSGNRFEERQRPWDRCDLGVYPASVLRHYRKGIG